MTDNVIPIRGKDVSPEDILEHAKGICTKSVVILGEDDEGAMYFATSGMTDNEVNWTLDQAKMVLLMGEVD